MQWGLRDAHLAGRARQRKRKVVGSQLNFHHVYPTMSSRLASFRGPSSPSPNPVHARQSTPRSPSSPSSLNVPPESPFHRKLRSLLLELRAVARTWDELVLIDGAKAAKSLVDTRTELESVSHLLRLILSFILCTPPDRLDEADEVAFLLHSVVMHLLFYRLKLSQALEWWDQN